jgi:hypothetical protein
MRGAGGAGRGGRQRRWRGCGEGMEEEEEIRQRCGPSKTRVARKRRRMRCVVSSGGIRLWDTYQRHITRRETRVGWKPRAHVYT